MPVPVLAMVLPRSSIPVAPCSDTPAPSSVLSITSWPLPVKVSVPPVCLLSRSAKPVPLAALAVAALKLLAERCPGCLDAPQGLAPATTCIEGDDLASAGISAGELESMLSGPERERVREWLEGLPTWMRTVFALRAVAGFNAAETAELMKSHGGPQAAIWTPEVVSEVFRQGLCSLASQVLHATAEKGS